MCTVMVVDSRAVIRNWIQECIKHSSIKISEIVLCESREEAIDYIINHNVDIALTRIKKEDFESAKLVKAMRKRMLFPIVLGYGVCKEFVFLCNVVNSGVSRYLEDIFNEERLEIFLNEAYERYCSNKMKLKYVAKTSSGKAEIAYSGKMLKEWVDLYCRNAVNNNEKNIDEYIEFMFGIMDNQRLYHTKSMIIELMIIINDNINKGLIKSDFSMLNTKECTMIMGHDNVKELKESFFKSIKKLAQNIYLLTSANDDKSLSVIEATTFIKNNYQKDISRDDVAEKVNLNPSYFSKFFKEQVGESFVTYLRRIRLEAAIAYLVETDDSVKAISLNVGYFDSKYFSKLFYSYTGYTPCEYRKCITKLMA